MRKTGAFIAGTRNQNGTESRKNIIFRIRADAHQPCGVHALSGVNDHPDRGQVSGFHRYDDKTISSLLSR